MLYLQKSKNLYILHAQRFLLLAKNNRLLHKVDLEKQIFYIHVLCDINQVKTTQRPKSIAFIIVELQIQTKIPELGSLSQKCIDSVLIKIHSRCRYVCHSWLWQIKYYFYFNPFISLIPYISCFKTQNYSSTNFIGSYRQSCQYCLCVRLFNKLNQRLFSAAPKF